MVFINNTTDQWCDSQWVHSKSYSDIALPECEFKNFSSECRTWGFSGGSVVRNLTANGGDGSLIPDLGGFHMPWCKLALGWQLLTLCSRAWGCYDWGHRFWSFMLCNKESHHTGTQRESRPHWPRQRKPKTARKPSTVENK